MAEKVVGQIAGQQTLTFGDFLWYTPPPPREMAAGYFAGHFSAIFSWFWAGFPLCSRPAKFRQRLKGT